MKSARVAMGPATFTASEVPVDTTELGGIGEVIAEKITIGGVELSITCLAIGNPHAVAIMDQSVEDFPSARGWTASRKSSDVPTAN